MKKFAGLIMALMLCACLYAQDAEKAGAPSDSKVGPSAEAKESDEESVTEWKYGQKMWRNSGNKAYGYDMIYIMTVDSDYMMCTVDDVVDKGGGKYLVTFKLDNGNGFSSKSRMLLSVGDTIKVWYSVTLDSPKVDYSLFKAISIPRDLYVKSIDETGFETTEVKPE